MAGLTQKKRYKVYVYNMADRFWDCYEVNASDPVDARNVAELADVCEVKE